MDLDRIFLVSRLAYWILKGTNRSNHRLHFSTSINTDCHFSLSQFTSYRRRRSHGIYPDFFTKSFNHFSFDFICYEILLWVYLENSVSSGRYSSFIKISWPILNSLHSAVDLLPTFVGDASSSNDTLQSKVACFYKTNAWMEFHNKTGSQFGGGTLHIQTSKPHSWTCMDLYIFATPYRVTWDYYFLARKHTFGMKEWVGRAEYDYPWVTNITVDSVHSGDFLAISKIRGLWGGFETMEKSVTGSYAGHTAVCLKDSEGKLWVGESGHENEKNVKETYGYHNMIFSWIDTVDGNYPPPLDAHLVASYMTVFNQLQPAYAANIWNEALNKRLGTQNLSLPEVLVETEKRGLPFDKLLTIPEQDNWVYSDGASTSCVGFILEMYKEAGLFDPIASSIQVTEFTIKDAYTLKLFENNSNCLPAWCNNRDDVKLPYCQIKGKYRMNLPDYNTMDPYPHMNERCPTLPPEYYRPKNC
ncbi:hypothetical protein MKX01_014199 [Papaver californicum]|nr:hypothetical protein MKX01_014199 [Papaver californicum]